MAHFSRSIIISNKLGIHARPATKLAQLTQQFKATVMIELEGKQVDASSIMGLMLLAGSQGKTVIVHTEGPDAKRALDEVHQLFTNKFDEEE
ncbi:HPr family phosphocarrier protein [Thalassotalea sp. PP2-459]|uniref:HPr family phosphocarrier protein n=1 Tax=Thalassotalea sp. PP2-459 TaxID=1742724 RepID=UPI0009457BBD|nr:HPr family phosphocarrier protein [Thalassotalea sp. PP2-459]OKY26123.1 phosphate ABC transporter permease [Thalassotalea sp. PP2-459]